MASIILIISYFLDLFDKYEKEELKGLFSIIIFFDLLTFIIAFTIGFYLR